jgi:aspartate/tyrosine/aromatic aminotransferase
MSANKNQNYFAPFPAPKLDAIAAMGIEFRASTAPGKVYLLAGKYMDNAGAPWVFPAIRKAEKAVLAEGHDHGYLPPEGDMVFAKKA